VDRGHLAGAGLALALAVGAGAWYSRSSPEPPPIAVAAARPEVGVATVHVSGAVVTPGLVEVFRDARVADVIAAAGGALPGARLSALNLAAPVADGQQLVVPAEQAGVGTIGGGSSDGKVRVNTAPAVDLERIPGVGPVLAERIRQHLDTYGPFGAVEDLLDVPGIGEGKLAALRDSVQIP